MVFSRLSASDTPASFYPLAAWPRRYPAAPGIDPRRARALGRSELPRAGLEPSSAYPGVFLYHCGSEPVLLHIANGMYGALIVDPKTGWGPGQNFVLVQSEFYTQPVPGHPDLLQADLTKMMHGVADVVAFNGEALLYMDNPLSVKANSTVRIFLVNAGPNHMSAFHLIGTIFQRVLEDGNPRNVTVGRQTVAVPPGGGAIMEMTLYQAGRYTFVTHALGDSTLGAMGRFIAK